MRWRRRREIVQDQIICRMIVVIFSDDNLRKMVRVRGGTALNNLHFPFPYRYSEDVDLVLVFEGSMGPIPGRLRAVLEPWLGPAKYVRNHVAPKLRFRILTEYGGQLLNLKVEVNNKVTVGSASWNVAYQNPAKIDPTPSQFQAREYPSSGWPSAA